MYVRDGMPAFQPGQQPGHRPAAVALAVAAAVAILLDATLVRLVLLPALLLAFKGRLQHLGRTRGGHDEEAYARELVDA